MLSRRVSQTIVMFVAFMCTFQWYFVTPVRPAPNPFPRVDIRPRQVPNDPIVFPQVVSHQEGVIDQPYDSPYYAFKRAMGMPYDSRTSWGWKATGRSCPPCMLCIALARSPLPWAGLTRTRTLIG